MFISVVLSECVYMCLFHSFFGFTASPGIPPLPSQVEAFCISPPLAHCVSGVPRPKAAASARPKRRRWCDASARGSAANGGTGEQGSEGLAKRGSGWYVDSFAQHGYGYVSKAPTNPMKPTQTGLATFRQTQGARGSRHSLAAFSILLYHAFIS